MCRIENNDKKNELSQQSFNATFTLNLGVGKQSKMKLRLSIGLIQIIRKEDFICLTNAHYEILD